MANHTGGDILNEVLRLLDARGFFRDQQETGTRSFLQEVLRIAWEGDCSAGDVFDGIGPRLGICSQCQRPTFEPAGGASTNVRLRWQREYPSMGERALIGLGSNLGDRRAILDAAIAALAGTPGVLSPRRQLLSRNGPGRRPVGQGPFLNAAAAVETTLTPHALHARLTEIEREAGRVRVARWGERTLDLDLLLFGDRDRRRARPGRPSPPDGGPPLRPRPPRRDRSRRYPSADRIARCATCSPTSTADRASWSSSARTRGPSSGRWSPR